MKKAKKSFSKGSRWERKWPAELVAPVLATLPKLPPRTELVLRARLQQMESQFVGFPYYYTKWDPAPSEAIKNFGLIAKSADKLANSISSEKFVSKLYWGLEEYLCNSWRDLVESGDFDPRSRRLPAPFKYAYDGVDRIYEPRPLSVPGLFAEAHLERIINDLHFLRDSAKECVDEAKHRTRGAQQMRRHRKSAEAHLLDMIFYLLEHLHRIFPKRLGKKPGRVFDAYAASDQERGPLVAFTKAVFGALQAKRPELELRDVSPTAIASAFRRWKKHPPEPVHFFLDKRARKARGMAKSGKKKT